MAQVQECIDIRDLAQFRKLWRALLVETPGGSFFQSLEWLETMWKHSREPMQLRVLFISRNNEAIGIVPLVVRQRQTRMGLLKSVGFPQDNWSTCFAPIGQHALISLRATFRHLRETRDWDVLEFGDIPQGPTVVTPMAGALRRSRMRANERNVGHLANIDIAGTFQRYWNRRDRELKLETELQESAICDRYQLDHTRYRSERPVDFDSQPDWNLFETCRRITAQTSHSKDTESFDQDWKCLRDVFEAAYYAGALDLNILNLDGRPAAFDFNVHFEGQINVVLSRSSAESDGIDLAAVLRRKWIADSFERLDKRIELGSIDSTDLERWSTKIINTYRYRHVPRTSFRAQLLHFNEWARGRATSHITS